MASTCPNKILGFPSNRKSHPHLSLDHQKTSKFVDPISKPPVFCTFTVTLYIIDIKSALKRGMAGRRQQPTQMTPMP